jgi:hypothetical protein
MRHHAILAAIETRIVQPFYVPQFLLSTIASAWFISTTDDTTEVVGAEGYGGVGQALRNSKTPPRP